MAKVFGKYDLLEFNDIFDRELCPTGGPINYLNEVWDLSTWVTN
jgi:hypothetical protein